MLKRIGLLAAIVGLLCSGAESSCQPYAPCYSAATIVNLASGEPGFLAPNTLAAIYGSQLSYSSSSLAEVTVTGGRLPTQLPGAGVRVLVGGLMAHLFLVTPTQINFLVPSLLTAGPVVVQVVRDGVAGPAVTVNLRSAAPALFMLDANFVIASHLDFSLVTAASPSRRGRWLILWATGLGETSPPAGYGEIPLEAAPLRQSSAFRVYLGGVAVPPERVNYVGLAPLCAGLYQINVLVPESVGPDPEIRIGVGDNLSRPGTRVNLEP